MDSILRKHVRQEIGINYLKPYHIDPAILVEAADSYFAVQCPDDGAVYYYPYSNVVRVIERPEGVSVGGLFTHRKVYSVVVKVGHLVDVAPMV